MELEMYLIRGLPGSGKSTLAEKLRRRFNNFYPTAHFEADQFFVGLNGEYHFNGSRVADAHHWCREQTEMAMEEQRWVVVSNTFSRIWELEQYFLLAIRFGYRVTLLTCEGNYGSVHGVPEETVRKMRERWEHYDSA